MFAVPETKEPIIEYAGLKFNLPSFVISKPRAFNTSFSNFLLWIDQYIFLALEPIGGERLNACSNV